MIFKDKRKLEEKKENSHKNSTPPFSFSKPKPPTPKPIEGIKKIIAVASGKGGVGKSTISTMLAQALANEGKKVGIVDADIHGPSIARMMGLGEKKEPELDEKNKMIPHKNHGVKCMSMGFLLPENAPVVWRGPMVTKALAQMMLGCNWGDIDVLIMDLPPGTGDIQLSMAQNYQIDGVILVSTPQEIALMDVKKAATMFQKVDIPIIGLIENMAYLEGIETGEKTQIFGDGTNIKKFCEESNIKLLKQIKIDPDIARFCDKGDKITQNPLKEVIEEL